MPDLVPTRLPEMMSSDRADLDKLLASVVLGHIAFAQADEPAVVPTLVAGWGDRLIAHGSTGSRWMRHVASGVPVCVSIAAIDGLIIARSTVESAVIYRSAVLYGSFVRLEGDDKSRGLDVLSERLLPGRASEVRPSTRKELAATMLLAMPIETWSFRTMDRWSEDPPEDVAGPAWAGVIRFGDPSRSIMPSPDLRPGIPVPASLDDVVGVR